MFHSRSTVLNFILNVLITTGLFWLFSQIGWINISSDQPLWVVALVVVLVNIVSTIIVQFALPFLLPFIAFLACCTAGLGLIVLPGLISYATLWITGALTGYFTMSTVWWQILAIGFAFVILRFNKPSDN